MIRKSCLVLALSVTAMGVVPTCAEPPMRISALDHVAIQVADLDKSVAFYKSVFGLSEVPAPFPIARWLTLGGGIMLHIVGNRTTRTEHSRWDHISIACGDMDVMIAKLDAQHVPWTNMEGLHTPQVRPDGVKQIFIQDPDGYWIEINDMAKPKS
jgi:lactoylglutathione lyase